MGKIYPIPQEFCLENSGICLPYFTFMRHFFIGSVGYRRPCGAGKEPAWLSQSHPALWKPTLHVASKHTTAAEAPSSPQGWAHKKVWSLPFPHYISKIVGLAQKYGATVALVLCSSRWLGWKLEPVMLTRGGSWFAGVELQILVYPFLFGVNFLIFHIFPQYSMCNI